MRSSPIIVVNERVSEISTANYVCLCSAERYSEFPRIEHRDHQQILTQYEDIYPPQIPTDDESDGANRPPSAIQPSHRRFSDGDESSGAERTRLEHSFLTTNKRTGKDANES